VYDGNDDDDDDVLLCISVNPCKGFHVQIPGCGVFACEYNVLFLCQHLYLLSHFVSAQFDYFCSLWGWGCR